MSKDDQSLNMLMIFVAILCVSFFLFLLDMRLDALDKQRQDALYCKAPGHSETYCGGKM